MIDMKEWKKSCGHIKFRTALNLKQHLLDFGVEAVLQV